MLAEWFTEGRTVEKLPRAVDGTISERIDPGQLAARLLEDIGTNYPLIRSLLEPVACSAATWCATLVKTAYGTTTDEQIAQIAPSAGCSAESLRAVLRRFETAVRLFSDDTLALISRSLTTSGVPPSPSETGPWDLVDEPATIVRRGELAAMAMVRHNLRLVLAICRWYADNARQLDLLDLLQEGSIGLLRAVERWEPSRGFAFSTLATWWIRQAIMRAIADQDLTIRLPVHVQERAREALKDLSVMLP